MGISKDQRGRLPRAKLFTVRLLEPPSLSRPIRTRGANFASVWVGRFQIIWRMPWLERPARALHPEVFQ